MFPASTAGSAKRWSFGTLAVLILSVLLHLLVLRSVVSLPALPAEPAANPVSVQLLPLPPLQEEKPVTRLAAKPVQHKARSKPAPSTDLAPLPIPDRSVAVSTSNSEVPSSATQGEPGMPADSAADEAIPDRSSAAAPAGEPPLRALAPPSAELRYAVDAVRDGAAYQGQGSIRFSNVDGTYVVNGDARLLFFSVLDFRSSGTLDEGGLAPVLYTEKRFRRSATNTHFQRERQLISFSASTTTYPRRGGEQDRASIVWQLASIGRADPAQLRAGRQLSIFVAGVRDGDDWILQVLGEETLQVAGRQMPTVHVVRHPRPGSYDQRIDIWFAPALEWYPVKLRFTETSGDFLDMNLAELPQAPKQE